MARTKNKIQRLSRILKNVFLIAACILPILNAGYWITNGYSFLATHWVHWDVIPKMEGVLLKPLAEMDVRIKLIGFLITLIPTTMNVIAFILVAKLFSCFECLEFFSQKSVSCLRKLGLCILFNQLIYPFYFAMISLALTITNPPGYRTIHVAIGTEQINLIVIGAIIMLISWVMDEGRKLQEEQASII